MAGAARLGISPSSIELKSEVNERVCSRVVLFASLNATLVGESRWARNYIHEKDIRYYTLMPEELGINLEYPQDTRVNNKKEIEVCLQAEKEGRYYGALIYSMENKPAAVGTWIFADIGGDSYSKLTGAFGVPEFDSRISWIFYLPTVLLFVMFLILLAKLKRKTQ